MWASYFIQGEEKPSTEVFEEEPKKSRVLDKNGIPFIYPKQKIGFNLDRWTCPIGRKDCKINCGNYGCGN